MKYIIFILCALSFIPGLFGQSAPSFITSSDPETLKGLSSFIVTTAISYSENNNILNETDLEYDLINEVQKHGMEVVNLAQFVFDRKLRDGDIDMIVYLHYDNRYPRVYYSMQIHVRRMVYISDSKCFQNAIIYSPPGRLGYCHINELRSQLKISISNLISPFLTDWHSVNKYIKTPTGVRFVPPKTNDPYFGLGVEEK